MKIGSNSIATKNYFSTLICLSCFFLFSQALATEPEKVKDNNESANEKVESSIKIKKFTTDEQNINYAFSGSRNLPGILFLHGTPGSWTAFKTYLANTGLQERYFMISVDRPGWGGNRPKTEKPSAEEISFTYQSKLIGKLLESYGNKKWLVVGHSLGASIAPKVALHFPKNISSLLLLAGSHNPKLGKPRWYNRIANTKLANWILPSHLNYSNKEIMVLSEELKMLESELKDVKLDTNVIVIQGMKDRLVSPKNVTYVESAWAESFNQLEIIEIPDAGHFLPWEETNQVLKSIRELHPE